MPTLWFVCPAAGRAQLAAICLRQLRRTCDALTDNGIDATAVVIADDQNLRTAAALGFATVRRDNYALGRKFNDGIDLALNDKVNPRPADFVVPIGSDDWVDWRILVNLPGHDTMRGFRRLSFVREDGREMRAATAAYNGGCGIRVYPRQVMAHLNYRPAEEDRPRACDTSILMNLQRVYGRLGRELRVTYGDQHNAQIVDWKSPGEQINPYGQITRALRCGDASDPFVALADVYPAEALAEMRRYYAQLPQTVAA